MYDINLTVRANGTLDTGIREILHLGTEHECKRAQFVFTIDSSIEGSYQYVKFYHPKNTLLVRVQNKKAVLPKNIYVHSGVWLVSFISSNEAISNNVPSGEYVFITEPIEAVVVKGILATHIPTEEETILKGLVAMSFSKLVIPECCESIGDYFLYNCKQTNVDVEIGPNVSSIGSYAFYGLSIRNIKFAEAGSLASLGDYAFSRIVLPEGYGVTLPRTLLTFGKYCFNAVTMEYIKFESNSQVETLGSNAFNNVNVKEIYLPDKLKVFSAASVNSYVIRKCSELKKVWIPNTLTDIVPATAIYECPNVEEIELQTGFNVSANFSNCTKLTAASMVAMFNALANRSSTTANTLTLGSTNLSKLNDSQKAIATNKNWTLS